MIVCLKEATGYGAPYEFHGFDGNNESEHLGVAHFLIEEMGRFTRFKKRDLNSHMPVVVAYNRMFEVFRPIRTTLIGRKLSEAELKEIFKARITAD